MCIFSLVYPIVKRVKRGVESQTWTNVFHTWSGPEGSSQWEHGLGRVLAFHLSLGSFAQGIEDAYKFTLYRGA